MNDIVWQKYSYKLRGNLIVWERELLYSLLVDICCII